MDIPGSIMVDVPRGLARDFTIMGNHIEFYGLCAPCRKLNRKN
jgi:hypothetical protein